MQFIEPASTRSKCPICGKSVVKRSTREKLPYCSRICASQERFSTRYKGTNSGPADRPTKISRTKLP